MRKAAKLLLMSALVGVPQGYLYFCTVLPNVTFPVMVRMPLYVPILASAGLGVLAGIALEGMDETILTVFGSFLFSMLVMSGLLLSPLTLPGIEATFVDALILNVLRMAFPVVLACFMVFFVASFLGNYYSDEPGERDFGKSMKEND
jgi:hypothetical protein